MVKQRKVLEVNEYGFHYVAVKYEGYPVNPYRIYRVWWDMGWHRQQVAKYGDMRSVVCHIRDLIMA